MRTTFAAVAALITISACDSTARSGASQAPAPVGDMNVDSAFKSMEHRHATVVGDPMARAHQFEPVAEGGDITLQREDHDEFGTTQIRAHLLLISRSFKRGDFRIPGYVHSKPIPGAAVMAAKGDLVTYTVEDLPRGGALRMRTRDPEALRAIHAFLAFQAAEHRTTQ